MKKQRLSCYGFILLLALAVIPAAAAPEARAAAATNHPLWKVEGKASAVYLLGSVHLLKAEDYPLPVPIEAAFTNSQIAVFETDIGQMEDPEVALKMMSKAQLPDGQTLAQQLSPGIYALYTNHLRATGMPVEMFDQLKPSFAAMTLGLIEMQKLGADPEYGVDKHFFDRARKQGKRIVPLETVDFQIGLITEFSKEEGELIMKATLKDIDKMKKEFGEVLTAWQTGDVAKLEKLLDEALHETPVLYKRLVSDRNQRWVPPIEALVRGGTNAIVIVGAGHLVGNDGVVELLKKRGLKVTQQ